MDIPTHAQHHDRIGVPSSNVIGSQAYAQEVFPGYPSTALSPHLVGFWPLNNQQRLCARDTSGNGNHFLRLIQNLSGLSGSTGWMVNSSGTTARLSADPLDVRFDIGAPGVSFIVAFETRNATEPGGQDQTVIAKGQASGIAGSIGLVIGMVDNGASTPRLRVVVNNVSKYSSNFPTWSSNRVYHVAVVRDSGGAMGTANRIYVYIDGVRDTAFDTVGYTAFAPTAQYNVANLALAGYGNNVTGADLGTSAANAHTLRNLQLALLQPNIPLPGGGAFTAMDALVTSMAADATHMLTAGELP